MTPPSTNVAPVWVVFAVQVGQRRMMAWCYTDGRGPGFADVHFTEPDGVTPIDAPDQYALGAVLFAVSSPVL